MIVPRLPVVLLALVLGALSAFAVACGEEREGLIASSRASDLQESLDNIEGLVSEGRCAGALEDNLDSLRSKVNDLPGSVDADLRARLRDGVDHLEGQAPEECREERTKTQPETTPETIPETVPPETIPEETTPPETTPPETTPEEPQPPQTTPQPEPPPEEQPPPDSGGEEAPLGNNGNGNGNGNGRGSAGDLEDVG